MMITVPEDWFILAHNADSDQMLRYFAFHLNLHGLAKYLFTSFQNENDKKN